MKAIVIATCLIMGSISCTEKPVTEDKPALPTIAHPELVSIRKSFSDIPIDNSGFCTNPVGSECVHRYQLMVAQLMVMDPIPVPQPATGASISVAEAVDRYNSFVAQYRGKPILAVFKQLYPRILLTKYGLLEGTDYAQILYFTRQLIEAKSYDSSTLTAALTKLKPHLSPDEFRSLRASVQEAARRRIAQQEAEIAHLSDTMATGRYSDKVSARLFPKEVREQLLARNRDRHATLLNEIDALNRL